MQEVGCGMIQDAGYGIWDMGCRMWDVGHRLAGLACGAGPCGLGKLGAGLPCVALFRRV